MRFCIIVAVAAEINLARDRSRRPPAGLGGFAACEAVRGAGTSTNTVFKGKET